MAVVETYGEYLVAKVSKVFPDLAKMTLSPPRHEWDDKNERSAPARPGGSMGPMGADGVGG